MKHTLAFVVFQFILLTLTAYQVTYIVTVSSWPPAQWFRMKVKDQYGVESAMTEFWNCANCVGFWLTLAVFAWAGYYLDVPLLWLQAIGAARLVGKLGSYD